MSVFDLDNNNLVSKNEFLSFFRPKNFESTPEEVHEADMNSIGKITWINYMKTLHFSIKHKFSSSRFDKERKRKHF